MSQGERTGRAEIARMLQQMTSDLADARMELVKCQELLMKVYLEFVGREIYDSDYELTEEIKQYKQEKGL